MSPGHFLHSYRHAARAFDQEVRLLVLHSEPAHLKQEDHSTVNIANSAGPTSQN